MFIFLSALADEIKYRRINKILIIFML